MIVGNNVGLQKQLQFNYLNFRHLQNNCQNCGQSCFENVFMVAILYQLMLPLYQF